MIHSYPIGSKNLRQQMGRIIDRSGQDRWPRIFQNLRASRETELCQRFPLHVVAAWLGNTPKVAEKHYLDVTEEDFQRAAAESPTKVQMPLKITARESKRSAERGADGCSGEQKQCSTDDPGAATIRKNPANCGPSHFGASPCNQRSSPGRTRTCDKAVNSRLLYQLSYRGLGIG